MSATPRNYWLEIEAADERESRLPTWAQERMAALRREANRLMAGTVEKDQLTEDDGRVTLNLGSNGYGGQLVRVLPENTEVDLQVTGGRMRVLLSKFGSRYRVRVVGMGTWDALSGERPEVAVLPALENAVEIAFVMPVPDTIRPALNVIEVADHTRQIEG